MERERPLTGTGVGNHRFDLRAVAAHGLNDQEEETMAIAGIAAVTNRVAKSTSKPPRLDLAEVARVAYELYEQRGRVDGHDIGDWLRAEEIVRKRR